MRGERRNPFEERPGGKRYRGQLDRIEAKVNLLTLLIIIVVILLIVGVLGARRF